METILQQLAFALGAGSLAGVNLYLTTFLTGIVLRFKWLQLHESFSSLEVLSSDAVLITSAALYLIEFFADKIPWIDSIWDTLHTLIRPLGGALLAYSSLGQVDTNLQVIGALLAGSLALSTHTLKTTSRLAINHSPEPFSNIIVSILEDFGVSIGLSALLFFPVISFILIALLIICAFLILRYFYSMIFKKSVVTLQNNQTS
jgi:Domain of unknown function (DUF4126)